MNPPTPAPKPNAMPPAAGTDPRQTREMEQRRNREIGHLLKGGAGRNRPPPMRPPPHSRGR